MAASEARILANQMNSKKSTGPTSTEGKMHSRCNALKHGMTGAGVVLPKEDAAEVERLSQAFEVEMKPSGEVGRALVRRLAVCSVRMDRGFAQETAALTERVRQAEADFVAPEGVDEAEVEQLRAEVCGRALFDPSKEATLARKYEAAAERGFFRALKELRLVEKQAKASDSGVVEETRQANLASFLEVEKQLCQLEAKTAQIEAMTVNKPHKRFEPLPPPPVRPGNHVPFAIGKPR